MKTNVESTNTEGLSSRWWVSLIRAAIIHSWRDGEEGVIIAGTVTLVHFTHMTRKSELKERVWALPLVCYSVPVSTSPWWMTTSSPSCHCLRTHTHTYTFITPLILKLCHGAACPSQSSSPSLCICKTEGGGEYRCWMLIFDSINSSATAHVSSSCQQWAYAAVSPLAHGQLSTLSSEWNNSAPAFFNNDGLAFY